MLSIGQSSNHVGVGLFVDNAEIDLGFDEYIQQEKEKENFA